MTGHQLRRCGLCCLESGSLPRLFPVAVVVMSALATSGCSLAASSVVAEALFQVGAEQPVLVGNGCPRFDASEYELFKKSQLALLKSDFLLQAALRDPAVASLRIVASETDPIQWLRDNLEVGFVDESDVLSISLRGSQRDEADLRHLADAVAKAYLNEVVYADRQRQLTSHDAMAKGIDNLRKELEDKMTQLEQEQAKSADSSVALKLDQAEVDVMLDLWRSLIRSLEVDDLNLRGAPDRVRQLQSAIIRSE
jgi:hypothetical protein